MKGPARPGWRAGDKDTRALIVEAAQKGWEARLTKGGHIRFSRPGFHDVTMAGTPKSVRARARRLRTQLANARPIVT